MAGRTRRGSRRTADRSGRTDEEERRRGGSGSDGIHPDDSRSVPELLKDLGNESSTLLRQEVALAKAEMTEKLEVYKRQGIAVAVGAAVLLVALLPFVETLVRGLTALFENWMSLDVAVWLAPLVVALVVGAVGYAMIRSGTRAIQRETLKPEKTTESLKRQQRWVRDRIHELREG